MHAIYTKVRKSFFYLTKNPGICYTLVYSRAEQDFLVFLCTVKMDSNSVTERPSLQRSSGRTARDRQRVARLAGHPALPADSRLSPTGRHYTVPWIESSSHLPGPAGASPPSVAADQSNLPGPAGASSPSVAADRPNLPGPAGASPPNVAADRPNQPGPAGASPPSVAADRPNLPGPAGASSPSVTADRPNLPGPAGASSPNVAADRPSLPGPAGASSPRVEAGRPNLPAGLLFMDGGETIYRYLAVPDSWLVEEEEEDESQNSQD